VFIVIVILRAGMHQERNDFGSITSTVDQGIMAVAMACLFVIVLAHEFGHCIACRWMRGRADEILLWPLGGLAYCQPPNQWKAHLITAIGGPLVNVVLCLIAGTSLGLITGTWLGVAIPNPLNLSPLIYDQRLSNHWLNLTLFLINYLSFTLLLFNLLPTFPLDGGRIVQSALWAKMGYSRSMRIAVRVGFVGAIVMGIFGAVLGQWTVVAIAVFGGITCYITQKQVQWTDEMMGFEDDQYALSLHYGKAEEEDEPNPGAATPGPNTPGAGTSSRRAERIAQQKAKRQQDEAAEVDRILKKIAESGMASLSRAEKKLLERETERKRQEK
jgi:stage IV sporulation protein FB